MPTARKAAPPPDETPREVGPVQEDHNGEEFKFAWSQYNVAIGFELLREERGEIKGEINIFTTVPTASGRDGLVEFGTYNLTSDATRDRMANTLERRTGIQSAVWWNMLKYACYKTVTKYRYGRPSVNLRLHKPQPVKWLLPGFLPKGETSVFYGDGKSTKSLNALAAAIAAATGVTIGRYRPTERVCGILMLDYETFEDEQANRVRRIMAGHGITEMPPITYLGMDRNLVQMMPRVRQEIAHLREHAEVPGSHVVVIVDSIAWAVGGEVEAAVAIPFFNALRALGPDVTRLVISHISKAAAEKEKGATTPYGTIFVRNAARSAHEVRSFEVRPGVMQVALYHRAINSGALQGDQAVLVDFHDGQATVAPDGTVEQGPITFTPCELSVVPEAVGRQYLSTRLIAMLRNGEPATIEALVEETGEKHDTIRKQLNKLQAKGAVVAFPGPSNGGRPVNLWRAVTPPQRSRDEEPPLPDGPPPSDAALLPF